MINNINAIFPAVMFGTSTACVLVLLLYFFKKETLLSRIGFMKDYSLPMLWFGFAFSFVLGLLGTLPGDPGDLSPGIYAFVFVIGLMSLLGLVILILLWRDKLQAS